MKKLYLLNKKKSSLKKEVIIPEFIPVGVELTYGLGQQLICCYGKKGNKYRQDIYTKILHQIRREIEELINCESMGVDGDTIEISTVVFNCKQDLIKYFKKLNKQLSDFDLVPSSITDLQNEGGCHINIDLLRNSNIILKDLTTYLYNNPSICWTFLSPYDNVSAIITLDPLDKGDMIYLRGSEGKDDKDYLELRFFMMPRTIKEMECHIDFAQCLMKFILLKKQRIKVNKLLKFDMQNFTFEQSLDNIQKVCKEIGFDFNRIKSNGKIDLLKQRHDFGKEFLN